MISTSSTSTRVEKIIENTINIASLVVGFLQFNTAGPIWLGCLSEILKYVRYLDITYSVKLQEILDEPDPEFFSIDYISSAPDSVDKNLGNQTPPLNFEKYGLSSSFLSDFWSSIIFLAGILVVLVLATTFSSITAQCKSLQSVFEKIKQAIKWNYLLGAFISCYSDIALFTALEFRAPQFEFALQAISFNLCLLTNTSAVVVLVIIGVILNRFARTRVKPVALVRLII